MARKFPYANLPCADEINACFHHIESILSGLANQEYIDYAQDSFLGKGKGRSDPFFVPPPDSLPDLWGNIYNLKTYRGDELYYANIGHIDQQGIISIDAGYLSPSTLVAIAKVWGD
jgi:hypothetical protein